MFEQPYPTNCHFDGSTRALVDDLLARTQNHGIVRGLITPKRTRKSCLDRFEMMMLEKHSLQWSYERIARHLTREYGIRKVNRSTIQRKIDSLLGK
ncbi:MAG: hypothetical protein HOP21_07840 [Methylotenera sp.]|nr:hypothetical protein [Methylotenera sp.]